MNILAIYDNGGKTADRYTVYFDYVEKTVSGKRFYTCVGMSERPFHPQGFGQHGSGQPGNHNGKKIEFGILPVDCRKLVLQEFGLSPIVQPLAKLKRKNSSWLRGFANRKYPIIDIDQFYGEKESVFVLKTGPNDYDYQLVYSDEVKNC
jgi:hypothetical protein